MFKSMKIKLMIFKNLNNLYKKLKFYLIEESKRKIFQFTKKFLDIKLQF